VGKKSFEGRSYQKDIWAAREAMDALLQPIYDYNKQAIYWRSFFRGYPVPAASDGTDLKNIFDVHGSLADEAFEQLFIDGCNVEFVMTNVCNSNLKVTMYDLVCARDSWGASGSIPTPKEDWDTTLENQWGAGAPGSVKQSENPGQALPPPQPQSHFYKNWSVRKKHVIILNPGQIHTHLISRILKRKVYKAEWENDAVLQRTPISGFAGPGILNVQKVTFGTMFVIHTYPGVNADIGLFTQAALPQGKLALIWKSSTKWYRISDNSRYYRLATNAVDPFILPASTHVVNDDNGQVEAGTVA